MAMTRGTTYAMTISSARLTNASIAMRSRRSRHHARRYGPAGVDSFGSRRWSAMTADTIGARAMSGGGTDPGVEEAIRHVHEQIREHVGDGGEQDDPLHERIVLRQDRVDRELSDALPREDRLDDDAARQETTELQADHGHHWDEGVAQRMAEHDGAAVQPFRPRGADVLAREHLEQGRACEARDERRAF